jgi:ubiquitin-conjugating enzyme E2 S
MHKRKMISSHENLPPQVISRVARELKKLATKPPEGIKYVPSDDDDSIAEIHADIHGPVATPFQGGTFRMKLVLSHDFPNSPPKGFFLTKIFHPNIAANGDVCVNTLKRDWTPDMGISHVLQVIRCLLIVPFPESSLNDDAGKLFMDDYNEYFRRAKLMTSVHAMKNMSSACAVDGESDNMPMSEDSSGKAVSTASTSPTKKVKSNKSASSNDKKKILKKKGLKRL